MKLWGTCDIGILGAMIVNNPQTGISSGAFRQGHNLHRLTSTTSVILTIPVFPPSC
jgi:hypothetical protein